MAFCSQCGAPQVRVPESLTAPATVEATTQSASSEVFARSSSVVPVNWRQARKAAAVSAVLMAFGVLVPPLNKALPVWMLLGGWLAVSLYRRRTSAPLVPAITGAKLGALAGVLGFTYVFVLLSAVLVVEVGVFKHGDELKRALHTQIEQAAASNPSSAQALNQLLQTPEGIATLAISVMFVLFLLFLLLSCAGGVFAASFSRQRTR